MWVIRAPGAERSFRFCLLTIATVAERDVIGGVVLQRIQGKRCELAISEFPVRVAVTNRCTYGGDFFAAAVEFKRLHFNASGRFGKHNTGRIVGYGPVEYGVETPTVKFGYNRIADRTYDIRNFLPGSHFVCIHDNAVGAGVCVERLVRLGIQAA